VVAAVGVPEMVKVIKTKQDNINKLWIRYFFLSKMNAQIAIIKQRCYEFYKK